MKGLLAKSWLPAVSVLGLLNFLHSPLVEAEEGMWLPRQLPALSQRLQSAGLELDSAKLRQRLDAVVQLGGCSAAFVSPEGLLITNYHCAYSSIQQNSSVDRNLLKDGFLAEDRSAELPASQGALVWIGLESSDVTARILEGLEGLAGQERFARIDSRKKALVAECERPAGSRCEVSGFYGGVEYWLYRYLEIRDVRLVYAPPLSIGQFGGEIDNFMWPRQTGDFAFFRAYVSPDGQSAERNLANRPYQPTQFLTIAKQPLKDHDFVMVAGHPGNTQRYLLAAEAAQTFEWKYPRQIEAYRKWIAVIEETTQGNEALALKYAGWIAGLNNTLKFIEGARDSYRTSGLLEAKGQLETELTQWIKANAVGRSSFAAALESLRLLVDKETQGSELEFRYHMATRSTLLNAAKTLYQLARERQRPDSERQEGFQERDLDGIRRDLTRIDSRFDPLVDRALFRAFLLDYQDLPAGQRRVDLDRFFGLSPELDLEEASKAIDKRLSRLYAETKLIDQKQRLTLVDATIDQLEASQDPFLDLAKSLYEMDQVGEKLREKRAGDLQSRRSEYMKALMSFMTDRGGLVYPDANSTLRLAYGALSGNTSKDGKKNPALTVAENLVARSRPEEPFDTPARVLQLLSEKSFGKYCDAALASLPINFMATVDVTGGNSGSPTLDRHGDLVGLLFDTNYESVISDWRYVPSVSRSVHLDIRYALWILDEVENADALLRELGQEPTPRTTGPVAPSEGKK